MPPRKKPAEAAPPPPPPSPPGQKPELVVLEAYARVALTIIVGILFLITVPQLISADDWGLFLLGIILALCTPVVAWFVLSPTVKLLMELLK